MYLFSAHLEFACALRGLNNYKSIIIDGAVYHSMRQQGYPNEIVFA